MQESSADVTYASGGNKCGCDEGGIATPGIEGRVGADDYAIAHEEWNKNPFAECDVLYSVGGLYGNVEAMKTVISMAEQEQGNVCIALNGDYHWFDATLESFLEIEKLIAPYIPMNGNVEFELSRTQACGVGCGCSYPTSMSDGFVSRSNAIYGRIKEAISQKSGLAASLKNRPAWGIVKVGDALVGLTHGDEKSVSGWGCSVDSLHDENRLKELDEFFAQHSIDILSTTHTCAAAAIALDNGIVINNGSAGLPEYKGLLYGLINRVAKTPHEDAIYRSQINDIYVEAVPVRYNQEAFIEWFDSIWEADSPAAKSYRPRAVSGPDTVFSDAVGAGFEILV
jgi:predicted phosphodiesterase